MTTFRRIVGEVSAPENRRRRRRRRRHGGGWTSSSNSWKSKTSSWSW
ncbi:hypothetical protein [Geodermatophilus sp. SYSU D00079]